MNQNVIIGGIAVLVVIVAVFVLFAMPSDAPETIDDESMIVDETPLASPSRVPTTAPSPTPLASVMGSPLGSPLATGAPAAGTVKTFNVTGSNFRFSPAEMRVKQGDTVRVTMTNPDTMPHDWRVDEFNAATKVITAGQTETVEFVASKKGTFEYYCSIGQHRANGMVGKLIVE